MTAGREGTVRGGGPLPAARRTQEIAAGRSVGHATATRETASARLIVSITLITW